MENRDSIDRNSFDVGETWKIITPNIMGTDINDRQIIDIRGYFMIKAR